MEDKDYGGEERRKIPAFTPDEIESIKKQLLESIYADIGKSIVRKVLWIFGAMAVAASAWLAGKGFIKL